MKKHNFNAGPSILPREVIENTAQAIDRKSTRPNSSHDRQSRMPSSA